MPEVPDYPMYGGELPGAPTAHNAAPPPPAFVDQVTKWYKELLGPDRTPSAEEVQSHYGNPSGLDGVYGTIANSKEAAAYKLKAAQTPATTSATTAATASTPGSTPSQAEQTIDSLYRTANIKDGGSGSGFADRGYWLAHPSEILNGRLGSDLAGTGPDQPEGTPGEGPWSNSGAADRAKWGGTKPPTTTTKAFVQGQRYMPADIPGLVQFGPGIFTDGNGHYFKPDGTGGGIYVGTDPGAATTTGSGTPGAADMLATLYSLANVSGGSPTKLGSPTSANSLGVQQAQAPASAALPMAGAPTLMDLARMGVKGAA